jgi:hypothetical protein
MKSRPLRTATLLTMLLTTLLLIVACSGRTAAPIPPAPPATTQSQLAAPPTSPPPSSPTSPPTAPPTNTAPAPTNTATTAPTNTAPPPTATSAPSATPTVAPTQKPSATPTPAPQAVVTGETLNVRSGPDTQFDAVARAARGDALTVVGQSDGCNWLKVLTAQGTLGWVARQSGGAELVKLNLSCAEIPALVVPTPTARPAPPTQPPQPTPTPAPSGLPADKGCYLFQNFMGAELNVTLNGPGMSDNFKIPANGERLTCLTPGRYNYTIDAPPPWADINGTLDVQAGRHFRFPVQGRP